MAALVAGGCEVSCSLQAASPSVSPTAARRSFTAPSYDDSMSRSCSASQLGVTVTKSRWIIPPVAEVVSMATARFAASAASIVASSMNTTPIGSSTVRSASRDQPGW